MWRGTWSLENHGDFQDRRCQRSMLTLPQVLCQNAPRPRPYASDQPTWFLMVVSSQNQRRHTGRPSDRCVYSAQVRVAPNESELGGRWHARPSQMLGSTSNLHDVRTALPPTGRKRWGPALCIVLILLIFSLPHIGSSAPVRSRLRIWDSGQHRRCGRALLL